MSSIRAKFHIETLQGRIGYYTDLNEFQKSTLTSHSGVKAQIWLAFP